MKQINLIIGYGYLGRRLLEILCGERNYLSNRSDKKKTINSANGNHQIILNINDRQSWANLNILSNEHSIRIYFMVPPSKIDRLVFSHFIERLNKLDIQNSILVSSTVVYGNKDRIVNADSSVNIDSERAERQYFLEQEWLAAVKKGSVIRFAGIYGPDRIIGKNEILKGRTINSDPDGWLNLIHADDGVKLLRRIAAMSEHGLIELASDGYPIKRSQYYSFLADILKQAPANFNHGNNIRGVGRRCDNRLTITRTGWQPEHSNFRKSIPDLIK